MIKNKIKLLIVYPASDFGGVAHYILRIIRHLPCDRFEIHVAVFGDGPLYALLRQENISTHNLKVDYSIFSFLPAVVAFRTLLRKENYNVIHAHTAKAGLLCCTANKGLFAKIIYTGHVVKLAQHKTFPLSVLFTTIERFIYNSSAFITVLSKSEYDLGISNGLLKSNMAKVVSMSIDVDSFLRITQEDAENQRKKFNIPPNAFVIGMIGRLTFQKDPELFVKVAATLNSQIDNMYLLWVGDGDLREKIIRMASRLGISHKLRITGHQDSVDIPKLLSAIDIVLYTSRFEGLPIALLEAMAAKKLIVAANVGSIQDIIQDNITGWLFEAGDYKKAALLVENIYKNKPKLSDIGKSALDVIVTKYSPKEKMAKAFQYIYEEVLK